MEKKPGNKQLVKQVAELEDKLDATQNLVSGQKARIRSLEDEIAHSQALVRKKNQEIDKLTQDIDDIAHNHRTLDALLISRDKQIIEQTKVIDNLTAEKVSLSNQVDEGIVVKDKLNQRVMRLESEVQDRIEDARQYKDYVKRSQTVLEKERDNFKDAWRTASKRVYMSCGLIMLMAVLLVGPSIWRMFSGS